MSVIDVVSDTTPRSARILGWLSVLHQKALWIHNCANDILVMSFNL